MRNSVYLACLASLAACGGSNAGLDAGRGDGGSFDAASADAGSLDGGSDGAAAPRDADAADAIAPADAAVDARAPSDASSCEACLGATIAWGTDGGLACTRDSSALAPCRGFTHRRDPEACDPVPVVCTNELPACEAGDSILVADVEAALANVDVVAALAAAPVLYGEDQRPSDGDVFYFSVEGRRVEVGADCTDTSCVPVPDGVRALVALLEQIRAQQLARPGCSDVFP